MSAINQRRLVAITVAVLVVGNEFNAEPTDKPVIEGFLMKLNNRCNLVVLSLLASHDNNKKETAMQGRTNSPDWRSSATKKLLFDDLVAGRLDGKMPRHAQATRPEYLAMDKTKFGSRFCMLCKSVRKDKACADLDNQAVVEFLNHRPTLPPTTNQPRWDGSAAQRQLRIDVQENRHVNITPQAFQATNEVYRTFSPGAFRNHIYQEVRHQKTRKKPKNRELN